MSTTVRQAQVLEFHMAWPFCITDVAAGGEGSGDHELGTGDVRVLQPQPLHIGDGLSPLSCFGPHCTGNTPSYPLAPLNPFRWGPNVSYLRSSDDFGCVAYKGDIAKREGWIAKWYRGHQTYCTSNPLHLLLPALLLALLCGWLLELTELSSSVSDLFKSTFRYC